MGFYFDQILCWDCDKVNLSISNHLWTRSCEQILNAVLIRCEGNSLRIYQNTPNSLYGLLEVQELKSFKKAMVQITIITPSFAYALYWDNFSVFPSILSLLSQASKEFLEEHSELSYGCLDTVLAAYLLLHINVALNL